MSEHRLFATVKSAGDDADFPGTFEVILSTSNVDRDNEVVAPYAFEPLPEYISFDHDHGMSVATTVGGGTPKYVNQGTELRVRGTWSSIPEAQKVRTLVREKHIRYTSVAFMGAEYDRGSDGVLSIVKAEILNAAFTPIPSNRQSVVLAAKAHAGNSSAALAYAKSVIAEGEQALALGGQSVRAILADAEKALAEAARGPASRRVEALLADVAKGPARYRVDELIGSLGDTHQKGASNGRALFF